MNRALVSLILLASIAAPAYAQDPAKIAPKVYTVVFENDQVRVLHVSLAAGASTPMHSHPDNVVVPLKAGEAQFTMPGGKTVQAKMSVGSAMWNPGGEHSSKNTGKDAVEAIIVELKGQKK